MAQVLELPDTSISGNPEIKAALTDRTKGKPIGLTLSVSVLRPILAGRPTTHRLR
jgi:hypothetical protein